MARYGLVLSLTTHSDSLMEALERSRAIHRQHSLHAGHKGDVAGHWMSAGARFSFPCRSLSFTNAARMKIKILLALALAAFVVPSRAADALDEKQFQKLM